MIVDQGRVVLIKRRFEPLAGQWSLPGGAVDVGETLVECVAREMLEETGLVVEVGPVVEVFDRIIRDDEGRVQFHYVLVDYVCRPIGGALAADSDVADAVCVDPADLPASTWPIRPPPSSAGRWRSRRSEGSGVRRPASGSRESAASGRRGLSRYTADRVLHVVRRIHELEPAAIRHAFAAISLMCDGRPGP